MFRKEENDDNVNVKNAHVNDGITVERKIVNVGDLSSYHYSYIHLGRHIIRDGDRPQTFLRSGDPFQEDYERYKNNFDYFGVNVRNNLIVDVLFKKSKKTLQLTTIPETSSEYSKYPSHEVLKTIYPAAKVMLKKMQIDTLPKSEIKDMSLYPFSKDMYPYFTYDKYLKENTKEKRIHDTLAIAVRR